MVNTILFPKGNGLVLHSTITEDETNPSSVKIKVTDFSVNGESASGLSRAKSFTMAVGDTIYITPSGFVQVTKDEDDKEVGYPDESNRFSNGSIYWVLSRVSETTYNHLETAE